MGTADERRAHLIGQSVACAACPYLGRLDGADNQVINTIAPLDVCALPLSDGGFYSEKQPSTQTRVGIDAVRHLAAEPHQPAVGGTSVRLSESRILLIHHGGPSFDNLLCKFLFGGEVEIYGTFGEVPVFDDGVHACRSESASIELAGSSVDDFLASNHRPFLPLPSFARVTGGGLAGRTEMIRSHRL